MAEFVTEKPQTVCAKCKSVESAVGFNRATQRVRRLPKREWECGGVEAWDPLDGERTLVYCREINTGNCPHFEAEEK